MHGKNMERALRKTIESSLSFFPVCAILGPRQVGKSTLAKEVLRQFDSVYLDLEKPSDLAKLAHAEVYFETHQSKLICLDEIQRKPEIFPLLRSCIDQTRRPGQFLILGSASPELLNQSSESLAGRIAYLELTPFQWTELNPDAFYQYWMRGGFPESYLAPGDAFSKRWLDSFIMTFLEKDMRNLGFNITSENLRRFWQMTAHYHGQIVNISKLGQSLNVSNPTVQRYMDIFVSTFMIRLLQPFHTNDKKRVIKTPKLYVRDSGICHRLLRVDSFDALMSTPMFGASYEGVVIENVVSLLKEWTPSFYRTNHGAEIDLILSKGGRHIAIECKATKAPSLSKGFYMSCEELGISERYVIALVDEPYALQHGVQVCSLGWFLGEIAKGL